MALLIVVPLNELLCRSSSLTTGGRVTSESSTLRLWLCLKPECEAIISKSCLFHEGLGNCGMSEGRFFI